MPYNIQPRRRSKLHLAFFLLVAFDALAVSIGVYLIYKLTNLYTEAIEVNLKWADMLESNMELGRLASDVNAPGNDVFNSYDVNLESTRMRQAWVKFDKLFHQIKLDLQTTVPTQEAAPLLAILEETNQAMEELYHEAILLFHSFNQYQAEEAGKHMAIMDQKYAIINQSLHKLNSSVSRLQENHLVEQKAIVALITRYEYLIAFFIMIMVCCAVYYSHAIAKQINNDANDRDKYLRELEKTESDLRLAMEHSEAASRAKSTFMATMSHELRTPLNAIIGYSELLQETIVDSGAVPNEVLPDLEKIQTAGQQLLGLVNGVLELSKVEAGKLVLTPENFEIEDLIKETTNTVAPQIARSLNQFQTKSVGDLGTMYADRGRVRQVLLNLLSNAYKFTEHGFISFRIERRHIKSSDWIEFKITDTGIGIRSDDLGKLFQSFSQVDGSFTRKHSGSGLGLAISQHLCHLMGGEIFVQSEFGRGSTFTALIPARMNVKMPQFKVPEVLNKML